MKIKVCIPAHKLKQLEEDSRMLAKITTISRQYAERDVTRTTLDNVVAMDMRIRTLTKNLKQLREGL